MKKLSLSLLCALGFALSAAAQPPVVTSGTLVLRLDVNSGAGTGNFNTVTHTWADLSGFGNHVSQSVASQSPTLTTVAGFNALNFNPANSQFLSNTATSGLTNTESSIFIVRTLNPALSPRTLISLNSKTNSTDEMLMSSGGVYHHTFSGNFVEKLHQCYSGTPANLPVVVAGIFRTGVTGADLDNYVNNVASTTPASTFGSPMAYTTVQRDIILGRRTWTNQYMEGNILEVLIYNKALSAADISAVNNYLKCKYNTNTYASASCNPTVTNCSNASCSDTCYWKVTGNNIIGGNNIFGTRTNDNILLQSNSNNRGIITNDGRWGWNTIAPTTLMHLYDDGMSRNRFGAPSGLRLENLPIGQGAVLVVDPQGYVYVSATLQGIKANETNEEMDQLKRDVAMLKQQLAALTGTGISGNTTASAKLFVYPNPAKSKLDVTILTEQQLAAREYTVTDMQGRVVLTGTASFNDKTFSINISSLAAGSYIVNLVSEGAVLGREKFIIQ